VSRFNKETSKEGPFRDTRESGNSYLSDSLNAAKDEIGYL
jgi:hypothetical protein